MLRLLKVFLFLAAVGGLVVLGYAYVGDLDPEQREISTPVTLDGDS